MAADGGLVDVIGGIDPAGFDHTPGGTGGGPADSTRSSGSPKDTDCRSTSTTPARRVPRLSPTSPSEPEPPGLHGRVTASHAFAVAELSCQAVDSAADLLAEADIALTTAALSATTVLPFRRLAQRGVRVGLGSDGVRNNWSPFGNADMLHRAWLLGRALDASLDEDLEPCFELAADGGAAVMGLPRVDLQPGSPADFMLRDGECVPADRRRHPPSGHGGAGRTGRRPRRPAPLSRPRGLVSVRTAGALAAGSGRRPGRSPRASSHPTSAAPPPTASTSSCRRRR